MENNQERAMKLATEAGHILLENGAEISRVDDTMQRIAKTYGVDEKSFFVLSNGIIPLVPGGGIFWTSYFVVTNQLLLAADTGFNAVKAAIAIAGGIIIMTAIFYRILRKYKLI